MSDSIAVRINGTVVTVAPGTSVAAALMLAGVSSFRRSVTGEHRGAFCGMGICFECVVTIDGRAHVKSCQHVCRPGMEISTDA